jgi:hypothetical protein
MDVRMEQMGQMEQRINTMQKSRAGVEGQLYFLEPTNIAEVVIDSDAAGVGDSQEQRFIVRTQTQPAVQGGGKLALATVQT